MKKMGGGIETIIAIIIIVGIVIALIIAAILPIATQGKNVGDAGKGKLETIETLLIGE